MGVTTSGQEKYRLLLERHEICIWKAVCIWGYLFVEPDFKCQRSSRLRTRTLVFSLYTLSSFYPIPQTLFLVEDSFSAFRCQLKCHSKRASPEDWNIPSSSYISLLFSNLSISNFIHSTLLKFVSYHTLNQFLKFIYC